MSKTDSYKLLDSGGFQKLEQVGKWRLIRPAAQAAWQPRMSKKEWDNADAMFVRDSAKSGTWKNLGRQKIDKEWPVHFGELKMMCKMTDFGHLGFFAEQFENWKIIEGICRKAKKKTPDLKVLNLFAYTGLASRAAARGGAEVVHVDASKTTVAWGKECEQKFDKDAKIRWLVDDVHQFLQRENRRGSRYHGIILDPPSFGRGPKGNLWKIEEDIGELLNLIQGVMDKDFLFMLLSCHSPGFTPMTLQNLVLPMQQELGSAFETSAGEMFIPENEHSFQRVLPSGVECWLRRKGILDT